MTRVHLTNDDGIYAKGVWHLYDALLGIVDPMVFTPLKKRAGLSKSVTLGPALKIRKIRYDRQHVGWAVNGTPADTVILYLKVLFKEPPRLVLSGINDEYNLGLLSTYTSGTLGAGYQAALMGVPSLGFAVEKKATDFTLRAAAKVSAQLVRDVVKNGMPEGVDVLNVNFPSQINEDTPLEVTVPILTAVRIAIDRKRGKGGERAYSLAGVLLDKVDAPVGSDWHAVKLFQLHLSP